MVEIVLAKLVVQGFICAVAWLSRGFWRSEVSEVARQIKVNKRASAQVTCPSLFLLSGPFWVLLLFILKHYVPATGW